MNLTDKCKEEFDRWFAKNLVEKELALDDFYDSSDQMKWGVYQTYFWETKRWWISVYPYTDKFGGKISGFWDEEHVNSHFITNVPEQAQSKIVSTTYCGMQETPTF